MSESWSQRMAAAVKKWGGSGPDLNGRYRGGAPAHGPFGLRLYQEDREGRAMLSIESPFFAHRRPRRLDGADRGQEVRQLRLVQLPRISTSIPPSPRPPGRRSTSYGTCISASRMVAGEIPLHRQLEEKIAKFTGVEDALLFVSGHAANVSTIGTLMTDGDLVVHDEFIHNSAQRRPAAVGCHQPQLPPQQSRSVREDPARASAATTRTC